MAEIVRFFMAGTARMFFMAGIASFFMVGMAKVFLMAGLVSLHGLNNEVLCTGMATDQRA